MHDDIERDGKQLSINQLDKEYEEWLKVMHESYDEKGIRNANFFVGLLRIFSLYLIFESFGGLILVAHFTAFWCLNTCGRNVPMITALVRVLDVIRDLLKP